MIPRFVVFTALELALGGAYPLVPVPVQPISDVGSQSGAVIAPAAAGVDPAVAAPSPSVVVPLGTPVYVAIDQPIFTGTAQLGDPFHVIVSENVVVGGATVIPKGTPGEGKVTFVAKNGSFGKSGILGIALRSLTIDGQKIVLDGRYREEAKNQDGATAMTFFMVGILAAPIRGKQSLIPAGRVLKARIGEEVALPPVSADVLETQLTNPAKSVQRPAVAWQPGNQPNTRPNIEEGVH